MRQTEEEGSISVYGLSKQKGIRSICISISPCGSMIYRHFQVVREVEAIGGNVTASASKEQLGYNYDALITCVRQMMELPVDSARNQVFLDWEVKEHIQKVKAEIGEYANNLETLLLEALHFAGYSGALANPLLASEGSLNSSILEEFVAV
ncbi:hypothetical protein L2E82_25188 [Cichorium intybus]|uniref:Uncharacterized protein n=1 Tax=Cichorium intybus TaxID=13427 RepID=A0ACB9E2C4_CICIN|nr:hypothetical protein L2E82_25188 [Cichorium intybus]